MYLYASVIMTSDTKIKYLHTLPHGEVLHEFETLYVHILNMTINNLNQILLALGTYYFPITTFSKEVFCSAPWDKEVP